MARRHSLLTSALAAGLVLGAAAPAQARVVERFPLDFSVSGQIDDFCGAGLTVDFTFDQTGTGTVRERHGVPYFQGHSRLVRTFTYEGRTVTVLTRHLLEKDLRITDNGDGTWTIIVLFTGPERAVDEDGRVLAKNDGQVRLRLIYDAALDDIVSEEIVFGSTGTNDDFCAAVFEYWGI
jgi:hypothetical protein